MKYCKKCKIAAKDTDTLCPKCGGPIASFGSAQPASGAAKPQPASTKPQPSSTKPQPASTRPSTSPGGAPPPPQSPGKATFTLKGQIEQLEEIKLKNIKRGRTFGILSLLLALAILFILFEVYSRTVLAYAVLANIKFEQDPIAENQITVSFDVITPGKVAFDRRSGSGHTEKLDVISTKEGHKTVWAWPSDQKTGIDFGVVYRGGWLLTSQDRHFDVTREGIGVDVVFLMDITSSMGPYIKGLKQNCNDFADQVRKRGLDCRLGLIGFGDVEYNEPILVFEPTDDLNEFQSNVSKLVLTNGGDPPESSVEAIEKALEMEFRPHTRVCFIHITDANCHHAERIPELAEALKEKSVLTYVISQQGLRRLYEPLCVNGGAFYGIRNTPFETILQEIAKSIVNQISSD
jgi:Mg-chelatase subunit ChlD